MPSRLVIIQYFFRRKLSLIFLLCLFPTTFSAQERKTINGVVHDTDGILEGASVTLQSLKDSTILAFGYTDKNGKFAISTEANVSNVIFSVRYLGYKTYTITIQIENHKPLDITLENDSKQLREVVVKAPKVWGNRDTKNYNVARLARAGDRSIGDVIRHIPGVRIKEGKIEYQGKPLKSVHIEGLDLAQGNYGIITNNIDASDITTIQILDNYQGIRSLVGKRSSDDVVINLKLSSKKRGIWGFGLDLGIGYGDGMETDSRIRGNYFTRKSQFLATSFVDNTGRLDYGRIRNAGEKNELADLKVFANVAKPSSPNMPSTYYLDNTSHYTNGNTVFTLPDSSRLYLQGSMRMDKIYSDGTTYSQYESKDSSIILDEHIHRMLRRLGFNGGVSYEKNLQQYYLKDRLTINTDNDKVIGRVSLNTESHPQDKRISSLDFNNQLHYINSKRLMPIELYLTQTVNTMHERFETDNNTQLENIFPTGAARDKLKQRGRLITVKSTNQIQIPYINLMRYWRYLPSVSLSYQYQELSSLILGDANAIHDNTLKTTIIQALSYLKDNASLDIILPLSYQLRHTSQDKLGGMLFEPSVKYKTSLGDHWSTNLSGSIKYDEPSISSIYPFVTLENYRSVTKGFHRLYRESTAKTSGIITYQDILSFFSTSLKVTYSNIRKPYVMMEELTESGGSYELMSYRHHAQNLFGTWSISKGFTWWGLGIDFDLGYMYNTDKVAFQGDVMPYINRLTYIKLNVKASPAKSILIDYDSYLGKNCVESNNRQDTKDYHFYQTARIGLSFSKHLFWDFVLDNTYLHSNVENSNSTLLSSELTCKLSKMDIHLELNNILNTGYYKSIMRLSYATIQNSYQLRPRSILLRLSFKI